MERYNVKDTEVNMAFFFQMPKFLFLQSLEINSNAKIVYALLKDRHNLSVYKKFANIEGEVFVIFPREKLAKVLNVSIPTIKKAMNKLIDTGLIQEERQGLNKPNLIYLTKVDSSLLGDQEDFEQEMEAMNIFVKKYKKIAKEENQKIEVVAVKNEKNETKKERTNSSKSDSQKSNNGTNIISFQDGKNKILGYKEFLYQDTKNFCTSIKENYLNNIYKDLSKEIDREKQKIKKYSMATIKKQIDYDVIRKSEELELIVKILYTTLNSNRKEFTISKGIVSNNNIKEKLLNLNQFHIEYVIECLKELRFEIKNIVLYVLTMIFNAPDTMDFYYLQKVRNIF